MKKHLTLEYQDRMICLFQKPILIELRKEIEPFGDENRPKWILRLEVGAQHYYDFEFNEERSGLAKYLELQEEIDNIFCTAPNYTIAPTL